MDLQKDTIFTSGHTYKVIKKLGEGFAGTVFLVNEEGRKEPHALKILNPEAYKEGQLESFKREFSVLAELHHPHLCQVFDFGFIEDEQKHFFTVEYIEGTDLYKCTDSLTTQEVEEIFVQIADGIGAIHAAGLIHFDIKGANTLVTKVNGKPFVKIVDFGLATPAIEVPKFIAGTVRYISPEMITKKQAIDYRADLYSMGIMLYRMLAKRYPNQGQTMDDILKWHVKHSLIDESFLKVLKVPQYLIDVVQKLTNPIPTNRFSSAGVCIKYIEIHSGKSYQKTQRSQLTALTEEGPLVGRDNEMRKLRDIVESLKEGTLKNDQPQVIVISGPPGIGKSRILKETKYIAQLSELNAIEIRALDEGRNRDKWIKTLAIVEGEDPFDLVSIMHKSNEFCLMIDDLDECSELVQHAVIGLTSHLYSARIMGQPERAVIIATMTSHSDVDALPIPIEVGIEDVRLKILQKEDITQYLRQFMGEPEPPEKQVDDIYEFSGGIPELVRIAISSLESPTGRISTNINRIFSDRIDMISEQARVLLAVMGFFENPMTAKTASAILNLDITRELNELTKVGLVSYDRNDNTYSLVSGAISRSISELFSKPILKKAAKLLFDYTKTSAPNDIDSIVKYSQVFADQEEVKSHLLLAAEEKDKSGDITKSRDYYKRYLDFLSKSDEKRPEILRKLAKLSILVGALDDSETYLNEAKDATSLTVEDCISLGWISRLKHNPQDALIHAEAAIGLMKQDENHPDFLRLLNEKAECYLQMGDLKNAEDLFRKSLEGTNNLSDEDKKRIPNNNLGLVLACRGQYDEAIDFYKKKYEFFADDRRIASSALGRLGYIYQQADRLDDAHETYKQSLKIASATGDRHNISIILANLICICQSKALFSDALHYAKESLIQSAQSMSKRQLGFGFLTIGALYIHLGLEDVSDRYLKEAENIFTELDDVGMLTWVHFSQAFLFRNFGNTQGAVDMFSSVITGAKELKIEQLASLASQNVADLLIDIGEFDKARTYVNDMGYPWPGRDKAREMEIQAELIRCKISALGNPSITDEVLDRIFELKELAEEKGFRELIGEISYLLARYYEKQGEKMTSIQYLMEAKAVIDNIAATLSEEYRDTYMKQRMRRDISEQSDKFSKLPVGEEDKQDIVILEEKDSQPVSDATADLTKKVKTKDISDQTMDITNKGDVTEKEKKENLDITKNIK